MNYLTIPFFKTLMQKREVKIALAFSFYPLLLILVGLFDTNFMQLSAQEASLSFIEFYSAVLSTQYQITLPLIVFIYISITLFGEEIRTGTLYLYKDIKKQIILTAKWGSIVLLQSLYLILTLLSSLVTYYTYLIHESYTSGYFLPVSIEDLQDSLISILGIILIFFLCQMVANLASILLTNGFTMLVAILFALSSFMAPSLRMLSFIYPNGYIRHLDNIGFLASLSLQIGLFVGYALLLYYIASYFFKRIEY